MNYLGILKIQFHSLPTVRRLYRNTKEFRLGVGDDHKFDNKGDVARAASYTDLFELAVEPNYQKEIYESP